MGLTVAAVAIFRSTVANCGGDFVLRLKKDAQ